MAFGYGTNIYIKRKTRNYLRKQLGERLVFIKTGDELSKGEKGNQWKNKTDEVAQKYNRRILWKISGRHRATCSVSISTRDQKFSLHGTQKNGKHKFDA